MAIIAVLIILVSWIAVFLCIPLSYTIRLYIGTPSHFTGTLCWLGQAFRYTWDYTYGQRPVTSLAVMGKQRQSVSDILSNRIDHTAEHVEQASLQKDFVTYEDVKNTDVSFPWKRYILNQPFAAACFRWIMQILHHSRLRTLTASGVIGLSRPHETGILAGILYAVVPDMISNLHFSYTAEKYDCTICGAGRLYPAVFIIYSAAFAASRPVRRLLIHWHTVQRGAYHGS